MVGIHDTIDRLQNKYLSFVEEKERTILTKEENMELVLPQNYVEIEQKEMMYLDGGDAQNFSNQLLLQNICINGKSNHNRNCCISFRSWSLGNLE